MIETTQSDWSKASLREAAFQTRTRIKRLPTKNSSRWLCKRTLVRPQIMTPDSDHASVDLETGTVRRVTSAFRCALPDPAGPIDLRIAIVFATANAAGRRPKQRLAFRQVSRRSLQRMRRCRSVDLATACGIRLEGIARRRYVRRRLFIRGKIDLDGESVSRNGNITQIL